MKFLDLKLKAAMLGGTYYFSHVLERLNAPALYGNREKHIIEAATRACEKNWKGHPFQKWLISNFAHVIAGLSALDNAYASFWNDFILEYNKLRGEQNGIPVPALREGVQKRGLAEQARPGKARRR